MLLAIDVGNTNITLGLWDGQNWRTHWRLRTIHDQTVDEYGIYLKMLLRDAGLAGAVDQVVLASVVPTLTATFAAVSQRYLGQEGVLLRPGSRLNIRIATDNPNEVGADRIANAVAAYHLFPGPSIVVDMGTATTFDVISTDGALLGVVIAPGLRLAAEALSGRAAQLSRVALESPPHVLGRNTVHAMQSGLVYGYASLVEGLVNRLKEELGQSNIPVIGTGGLINLITAHTPVIDHVDPWLTLTGLRVIAELNQ